MLASAAATTSLAELRDEHQSVLRYLRELRCAVMDLAEGQRLEAIPALWRWTSFIDNALLPHFELEEKTIPSLMAQKPGPYQSLAEELVKEHTHIIDCLIRYKQLMRCDGLWSTSQELERLCLEISDIPAPSMGEAGGSALSGGHNPKPPVQLRTAHGK